MMPEDDYVALRPEDHAAAIRALANQLNNAIADALMTGVRVKMSVVMTPAAKNYQSHQAVTVDAISREVAL